MVSALLCEAGVRLIHCAVEPHQHNGSPARGGVSLACVLQRTREGQLADRRNPNDDSIEDDDAISMNDDEIVGRSDDGDEEFEDVEDEDEGIEEGE